MPIDLVEFDDLKEYVEDTPVARIYYLREGLSFAVLAGKVSWRGVVKSDGEGDRVEEWLKKKGGVRVNGWLDVERVFDFKGV
ncbi:MAG: hypothetical protein QW453_06800 [Thermoprotei archaeon]